MIPEHLPDAEGRKRGRDASSPFLGGGEVVVKLMVIIDTA
jgi:hypothetical protein